jgi:Transcriptional regulator, AbiEi antitoxin
MLELARLQAGVLSLEQCSAYGLSRHSIDRLLQEGHVQRLERGLMLLGFDRPSWLALAWGGVLLGGTGARLGGLAAAYLHGLGSGEPADILVHVPHGSPVRRGTTRWTFQQERPGSRRRSVGSPPRLGVEDTVLDLSAAANAGDVVDVLTRAVQSRLTTVRRLRRRMDERSHLGNRKVLAELLGDIGEGAESPLELRFLGTVERPHCLPKGARQHRRGGHLRDVCYEEFATVVELDGRVGHVGVDRFRDMRRDNRAAVSGELTLRYGYWDVVEQPCLVARQLASVLSTRGWRGTILPCPNCEAFDLFGCD